MADRRWQPMIRLTTGRLSVFLAVALLSALALSPTSSVLAHSAREKLLVQATGEDPHLHAIASDPFCGLWSIYAGAQLLGTPVEFEALVNPEWVNGTGSSLAQLQGLASEVGLTGQPFAAWTRYDLLACPHPVILHVNSDPGQPRYQHWVLWLGADGEDGILINGPLGLVRMPMKELSVVWDGRGLVLRPPGAPHWTAWPRWALLGGVVTCALAAAWAVSGRPLASGETRRGSIVAGLGLQTALIIAAATAVAAAQGLVVGEGLLANKTATDRVIDAHLPDFLPKLGLAAMRRAARDPDVIVIDARFPDDYRAGHIEGAINVPVGNLTSETLRLLKQRGPGKRLVIYCESRWCEYDEFTARALLSAGFDDLALFPGGWREWNGAQ